MRKRIDLIIIDPQNDFCHPKGSLFVNGAIEDMKRVSVMINNLKSKISRIHVTMDSHRTLHIAHPLMWVDKKGNHPNPFTLITYVDVEAGVWKASFPPYQKRQADYVKGVEANKRYVVCIWPPHCQIGTPGHAVFNGEDQILSMPRVKKERDDLFAEISKMNVAPEERLWDALTAWEKDMMWPVNYVTKGSNMFTEHYSAVLADVPDPKDPSTQLNNPFIHMVDEADMIVFAGEAGSHCLKNTAEDMFSKFGPDSLKKVVLLTDATSSVPGFENLYEEFVKKYVPMGMTLTTTKEFLK
jgi:nicotinamidase/pyrazinamidase